MGISWHYSWITSQSVVILIYASDPWYMFLWSWFPLRSLRPVCPMARGHPHNGGARLFGVGTSCSLKCLIVLGLDATLKQLYYSIVIKIGYVGKPCCLAIHWDIVTQTRLAHASATRLQRCDSNVVGCSHCRPGCGWTADAWTLLYYTCI